MKERTALCIFLTVILVSVAFTGLGTGTSSPLIYVDPPEYLTLELGEFTADINIADASNLQNVTFKLSYNTALLDVKTVTKGEFMKQFGGTIFSSSVNESLGCIEIVYGIHTGGPASGSGTLAIITFNTTYKGTAWCTLDLHDTALYDPGENPIDHEVADGYYEFVVLGINVVTDKLLYTEEEFVIIQGNLTTCRAGGLVALEVKDPRDKKIVFRTLQNGTDPPIGNVTIIDMYPCNLLGEPKFTFYVGTLSYFKVVVKNNGPVPENVTITINIYDSSVIPSGVAATQLSLESGASTTFIGGIPIPTSASSGNGTVYANVFTAMPNMGGTAHCPEESAQFNITGGSTPIPGEPGSTGIMSNYNLSFRLPTDAEEGWYMVYVGSSYQSLQFTNNTAFGVPPCPPLPSFTYTPIYPSINQAVTFDASASSPGYNGTHWIPIANYTWDFGDEDTTTTTEPTVIHQYATNETYTVTLTATCEDDPVLIAKGLTTNTVQQSVKIYQLPYGPKAIFTYTPPCPSINQLVTFDASASHPGWNITVKPIVSYEWDFGDGNVNVTSDPTFTHEYVAEGVYNVTLNVTDTQGLWNFTSKAVSVYPLAMAGFTVTLPYGASAVYPGWGAYPEDWRQIWINVTVENKGAENETFSVTLYYEDQQIHDYYGNDNQTVTNLAPGNNVTLTFHWVVGGVDDPQYTRTRNIYVNIPNPTLGDIEWQGSTATVRGLGDANGNGHCGGADFTVLGMAWWVDYPHPYYDPRADFNGDGDVRGEDFTYLAMYWYMY